MVREIFLFVPLPSSSHIPILSPNLPTFSFPGSVFDSSRLFSGPQWCAFLISSLLFYSFFHFLCHLFCLTLTVYLDSLSRSLSPPPPLHFYKVSAAPTSITHPLSTRTALFYVHCSCVALRSGDGNICSSACLKPLVGERFLSPYICSCLRVQA